MIIFLHALSFFGQMFSKILNTWVFFSVNSINFANFKGGNCKKINIKNLRKNTNPGLNSWSSLIPTRHYMSAYFKSIWISKRFEKKS